MQYFLDQQPTIQEITTYAETPKWNKLGVKLELNSVDLAECCDCTSMYQLWLEEKSEKATRRSLLDTLTDIRQNDVARKYKVYIDKMVSYLILILILILIDCYEAILGF